MDFQQLEKSEREKQQFHMVFVVVPFLTSKASLTLTSTAKLWLSHYIGQWESGTGLCAVATCEFSNWVTNWGVLTNGMWTYFLKVDSWWRTLWQQPLRYMFHINIDLNGFYWELWCTWTFVLMVFCSWGSAQRKVRLSCCVKSPQFNTNFYLQYNNKTKSMTEQMRLYSSNITKDFIQKSRSNVKILFFSQCSLNTISLK